MHTIRRRLYRQFGPCFAIIGILFVGCGSGATPSTAARVTGPPVTPVDIALLGPGSGFVLTSDALLSVKGDNVAVHKLPAVGVTAFAAPSADLVAVAILSVSGLLVVRSVDGGASWTDMKAPDPELEVANVSVAMSVDGSKIVVLAERGSSSNFSTGVAITSLDSGLNWMTAEAPIGGQVAVVRDVVWLAGGPQNDQLFSSTDGKNWKPTALAPADGPAGVQAISTPVAIDGQLLVAATIVDDNKAREVTYLSSNSGSSWSQQSETPLTNSVVAGLQQPSTTNGTKLLVVQSDGNHLFQFGTDASEPSVVSPNGLGPSVQVIRFVAGEGWAINWSGQCAKPKEDCSTTTTVLTTSDSGQTWNTLRLN